MYIGLSLLASLCSGCLYSRGFRARAAATFPVRARAQSDTQSPEIMMTTVAVEQEINAWEEQAARFDLAAKKLNLDEGLWKVLRYPNREIILHIPVALDNGKLEVYTGFRVQHSIARGPAKGGLALFARRHAR